VTTTHTIKSHRRGTPGVWGFRDLIMVQDASGMIVATYSFDQGPPRRGPMVFARVAPGEKTPIKVPEGFTSLRDWFLAEVKRRYGVSEDK
jgi:hypothetical protein